MEYITLRQKLEESVKKASVGAAVGIIDAAASAIGGQSRAGREASKSRAETSGERAGFAKKIRKSNPGQYVLNPATLAEVGHRISRRYQASKATHPGRTSLIPLYGAIRGGKAGKDKLENKSGIVDKVTAYMKKHPNATKATAMAALGLTALKVRSKIKNYLAKRKNK